MDDDAIAKRRASRRKLNLIFGTMFLMTGLCFYIYDVERNIVARRQLVPACETLRRELPARMPDELMRVLFGEDAPFMRRMLVDSYGHRCDETLRHLSWWQWNLGVKIDVAPPAADRERAARVLERAAERCPGMARQMFTELHGLLGHAAAPDTREVDHAVVQMCAPISDAAREMREHQLPMSAWDEAGVLVAIAKALDDQDARPQNGRPLVQP